jgi:hypothetical protein
MHRSISSRSNHTLTCVTLAALGVLNIAQRVSAEETRVPLTFSGGHETDPRDRGRPVILIAAALGVTPEIFREAFSGVTPSRNGPPTGEEARRNKEALMKVLGPHGITNGRLDEVSNYYRYQPQRGDLWKHKAAQGHAVIENGQIKQLVVTDAGAGYSSPPQVSLQGFESTQLQATVQYGKDLRSNGGIKSVAVAPAKPAQ